VQPDLPPSVADELRASITRPDFDRLARSACRGLAVERYFPDEGEPSAEDLDRCERCEARIACLALALRTEDPHYRFGWFGGVGPAERSSLAEALGAGCGSNPRVDRAAQAARLRAEGWTLSAIALELNCCQRTVQRDLTGAA
jgi:hypothetical protein